MFEVKVISEFSSAHNLRGYHGKCENLHGHNWKVEIVVSGQELDKLGMLMDFKQMKLELNKILDNLDHKYLNEDTHFSNVNPTSENIAEYIFNNLKVQIPQLKLVTVWESSNSAATYYGK